MFHQPSIGFDEVAIAFLRGRAGAKPLPLHRQQQPQTVIEPVDLTGTRHRHPDQDDSTHPLRMTFGPGQDQGGGPRPAVEQPPFHTQVLTERFHVRQKVFGGVVRHVGGGVSSTGHTVAAPALVERHDPKDVVVKRLVSVTRSPAAWPAMHDQNRSPCWVASDLPIDPVAVTDIE